MDRNQIQVFNNSEFENVRTVLIDNDVWFVGADVAKILGYENPRKALRDHIDDDDRKMGEQNGAPSITDSLGRVQYPTLLNESGVYTLIFRSHLPFAKRFKHWVTSVILPSIRQNGGYLVGQEEQTPEQIVANALVVAQKIIAEKERKLQLQKPKVEYFDALVDSKLLTNFRDTAKELHMEPLKFSQWLIERGYIYRDKHNMIKPHEIHVKNGLFEMKDFTKNGYSNVQTFVTVKGKETFRLLLQMEGQYEECYVLEEVLD